jgi:protein-S-isoprenylcysteine O-methyltransferase Ste14
VIRVGLFVIASMLLAHVSKASLRRWRAHGFYRFLAWEFILLLSLLNFRGVEQWFGDPASWRQLASWILLFGSIVPAVWGAHLLRSRGGALAARDDRELLAFERTTRLVTAGIYKYIRHPMYASLLMLTWGVFFKRVSVGAGVAALCATAALVATARAEERENCGYFGEAYRTYMARTKMFVPFVL